MEEERGKHLMLLLLLHGKQRNTFIPSRYTKQPSRPTHPIFFWTSLGNLQGILFDGKS